MIVAKKSGSVDGDDDNDDEGNKVKDIHTWA
jgi:hypothetical protein